MKGRHTNNSQIEKSHSQYTLSIHRTSMIMPSGCNLKHGDRKSVKTTETATNLGAKQKQYIEQVKWNLKRKKLNTSNSKGKYKV